MLHFTLATEVPIPGILLVVKLAVTLGKPLVNVKLVG